MRYDRLQLFLPLVVLLTTATITGVLAAAPNQPVANPAASMSLVFVVASPNAYCDVHPTGQAQPVGAAHADDQGVVRLYQPSVRWGASLSLDCTNPTGLATTYLADLTSPGTFQAPPEVQAPTKVRPALPGDVDAYSDKELIAMGYPPHPRTNKSSVLYAKWKHIVSTDSNVPALYPIADLDGYAIQIGNPTTSNWGGGVLNQPFFTYEFTEADFVVPQLNTSGLNSPQFLMWTGVGGLYPNTALIQTGIGYTARAGYFAFVEYANNSWINVGGVTPGDQMYVSCWASDAYGNYNPNGFYGSYLVNDEGQGPGTGWSTYLLGYIPRPLGDTAFTGTSAEYAIEAVCTAFNNNNVCTQDAPFPDWVGQSVSMVGDSYDSNGGYHDYSTDGYFNYELQSVPNKNILTHSTFGNDPSGEFDQTNWTNTGLHN